MAVHGIEEEEKLLSFYFETGHFVSIFRIFILELQIKISNLQKKKS